MTKPTSRQPPQRQGDNFAMTQYLIKFDDGDMDFPEEDLPAVGSAVKTVVLEARATGAWVFGAGLHT